MTTEYIMQHRAVLDDDHSFVHLVDSMPRLVLGAGRNARIEDGVTLLGDQRIVEAARTSISGKAVRAISDDGKLIHYLMKHRHTSPFESVVFQFHMRMPIFIARQIIRHRTARVNEESARYGVLRDDFYVPTIERLMAGGQAKQNKQGSGEPIDRATAEKIQLQLHAYNQGAYGAYENLLEAGLARELARIVLPLNIYTQWFWQMDLHNLLHFLTLRLHSHAQWEVRRYAEAMVPMARALAPIAMQAFDRYRRAWERAITFYDDEVTVE
jgi:thymidylate synthase (FAD)